jgi:uncharacterized protein (UPF0261 family)
VSDTVVYIIGTFDTKADELNYTTACVQSAGAKTKTIDVSTTPSTTTCDHSQNEIASCHPKGSNYVLQQTDRGTAVTAMAEALSNFLVKQRDIGAVIGLGGSGNTALVTAGMRALPIGIPKLMVSTLAAGNVSAYVGASDIMMMHSVADIAGLNDITRRVLANAAHAAAGMALHARPVSASAKRNIAMTMFGVTTPLVAHLRKELEHENECFVFHATGTGGQCMEKLIESGLITAAIDVTTTEVADYLFGGTLPCTADRFGAIIRTGIPYIGSVGAVDMINFGPRHTVPEKYATRHFHIHNSAVTLMRTTSSENHEIGKWIVERINEMTGPTVFLLPLQGVSSLDASGQAFFDPLADKALFDAIRASWKPAGNRKLIEVDDHINSLAFAQVALDAFNKITRTSNAST